MELACQLRATILHALRAGKQPLDVAREFGVSLLVVADVIAAARPVSAPEGDDYPMAVDEATVP